MGHASAAEQLIMDAWLSPPRALAVWAPSRKCDVTPVEVSPVDLYAVLSQVDNWIIYRHTLAMEQLRLGCTAVITCACVCLCD